MLTKIVIHQFRSCFDIEIDLARKVVALVGRNGAGKTNVLQAMVWVSRFASDRQLPRIGRSTGSVTVEIGLANSRYRYSARVDDDKQFAVEERLDRDDGGGWSNLFDRHHESVRLEGNQQLKISGEATCIPAMFAILPEGSAVLGKIAPFVDFLTRVHYYHLDEDSEPQTSSIVFGRSYDEWLVAGMPAVKPTAEHTLLRLVEMYYNRKELFDEVAELIGPNGLGLIEQIRVDRFSPGPEGNEEVFYYVRFSVDGSNARQLLGIDQLSFGTRRVLSLVISLFDSSSVALFEHPEDAIHRGLLVKVIELLKGYSEDSQLILATHSPVIFNLLDAEDIRLVTWEQMRTRVRPLSQGELAAGAQYLQCEGTFSDFLDSIQEN